MGQIVGIIVAVVGVVIAWLTFGYTKPSSINIHTPNPISASDEQDGAGLIPLLFVNSSNKAPQPNKVRYAFPIEFHVHNEGRTDLKDVFLKVYSDERTFDANLLKLYDYSSRAKAQSNPIRFERFIDPIEMQTSVNTPSIRPNTSIIYEHIIEVPHALRKDPFGNLILDFGILLAQASGESVQEKPDLKFAIGSAHIEGGVDDITMESLANLITEQRLLPDIKRQRQQHTFLGYLWKLMTDDSERIAYVVLSETGEKIGSHRLISLQYNRRCDAEQISANTCPVYGIRKVEKAYQWRFLFYSK